MAGQKAKIDKDTSGYRSPSSAPEAERETAYHDQKSLEGTKLDPDREGFGNAVFKGTAKPRQGRRPADQSSSGTTGIGDTGTGLETQSYNPFMSVVKSRFVAEAENPGVASAPATSDSPSLGMMAVNNTDFRQPQTDVRAVLEGIALQAAETFELLDEASNVPDAIINELQNTAKAITRIYEYVTKSQGNSQADPLDTSPVAKDTAQSKPGVNEEVDEEVDEAVHIKLTKGWGDGGESMKAHKGKLVGNQHKIDANKNGRIDAHDFKLLRSKKTMKEAVDIVFGEVLRGRLDGDN